MELTAVETSRFPSYLCLYMSYRTAAETLPLQEDNIHDCGMKSAAGSMKMTHENHTQGCAAPCENMKQRKSGFWFRSRI